MQRPAPASGGSRYLGESPLRLRGIATLRCRCHALTWFRPSNTATRLPARTPRDGCLQSAEERAMIVAQSHTEKGLTRLYGASEAIAKARDGHLGRALLYHTRPPVATRRASAFAPIRCTDSRWEEDPSRGQSQPEYIQPSTI